MEACLPGLALRHGLLLLPSRKLFLPVLTACTIANAKIHKKKRTPPLGLRHSSCRAPFVCLSTLRQASLRPVPLLLPPRQERLSRPTPGLPSPSSPRPTAAVATPSEFHPRRPPLVPFFPKPACRPEESKQRATPAWAQDYVIFSALPPQPLPCLCPFASTGAPFRRLPTPGCSRKIAVKTSYPTAFVPRPTPRYAKFFTAKCADNECLIFFSTRSEQFCCAVLEKVCTFANC